MTQPTKTSDRGRYVQVYLLGEEVEILDRVAERNGMKRTALTVRVIRAFCRETLKREREAARVRRDRS